MSSKLRSIERKAKTNELKITLGDLINSRKALINLCALPIAANKSFDLKKMLRAANGEFDSYDAVLRSLCERLGALVEDGRGYKILDKNQPEFQKEMDQLLATEVVLPNPAITLAVLKKVEITALDLTALDWLVTES